MLRPGRFIPLTDAAGVTFDHGACDAGTGRVFVAHTSADRVEVFDHRAGRHLRALTGFPEAAGVVAAGGRVVVTNRGAASVSVVDAAALATLATFPTAPRPNGVAFAAGRALAVAACLGDDTPPVLHSVDTASGASRALPLPGRPRWCVVDAAEERVFCAIRDPSLVLAAGLPGLRELARWPLPSAGAHGVDLDDAGGRLFVACDGGGLAMVDTATGRVAGAWPLPGVPDATFYNPDSGRVHVAIGDPGVVVSLDPASGRRAACATGVGAKTTALAVPDRLYAFLPRRGGALELLEQATRG